MKGWTLVSTFACLLAYIDAEHCHCFDDDGHDHNHGDFSDEHDFSASFSEEFSASGEFDDGHHNGEFSLEEEISAEIHHGNDHDHHHSWEDDSDSWEDDYYDDFLFYYKRK